ncbi:MAG TPA: aldo/keto reductase [bacterium]|nr:aldo/keto reductase [bacterium]
MIYRQLGRTGLKVAPLVLGGGNFADPTPAEECGRIILRALEAGINVIDTGDSYAAGESERIIGRVLAESGRRDEVLLMTKVHYPVGPAQGPNARGNSRRHILRACEASLRRLRTEAIDLYLLHRPSFDIPLDETLGALTDLVRQGKVLYIGTSTHPAWKVLEGVLLSELRGYARFVVEQPPYNLLDRRIENELVPMCQAYGLGIFPWAPAAMGVLLGRYSRADAPPPDSRAVLRGGIYAERVTEAGIEVGRQFVALAREHGLPPVQAALLWVKDQPGITAPIFGPRTVEQLEQVLPVAEMSLDPEFARACDALVAPGSAVANFHNTSGWMRPWPR